MTRGTTLLEVLIVFALVVSIGSVGAALDFGSLRASGRRSEAATVAALLRRARALSLHGVCTEACAGAHAHGLYVDATRHAYVLFEGSSYAARAAAADAVFPASGAIEAGGAREIVFAALSATSSGGRITLRDDTGRTSDIDVSPEGRIAAKP